MPEEEGEDEPDADAHDPGHQHKHQEPDVREGLKEKVAKFFSRHGTNFSFRFETSVEQLCSLSTNV